MIHNKLLYINKKFAVNIEPNDYQFKIHGTSITYLP